MQYVLGIIGAIALIGGGFLLFSSSSDTPTREAVRADGEFTIVASFYPLAFALETIAGDAATVVNISEGRDPHDYRPSARDLEQMQQADLVVLQGAGLEPWGADVRETLEAAGVPVAIATEPLSLHEAGAEHAHEDEHTHEHEDAHTHEHEEEPEHEDEHETEHTHEHEGEHEHEAEHDAEHMAPHEEDHTHEDTHEHEEESAHEHENEAEHDHAHDHGGLDPHTWLDPVRFGESVDYLRDTVRELDPEYAATYAENAAALRAELAELDTAYRAALAECTADSAIVSHDAFGYLADRYGLTMHPIAGLSTADTPSAAALAALREEARESGSQAVLTEESAVTEFAETVARETDLTVLPMNPIAFAIPDGDDYISLMRGNLESLQTAYACPR